MGPGLQYCNSKQTTQSDSACSQDGMGSRFNAHEPRPNSNIASSCLTRSLTPNVDVLGDISPQSALPLLEGLEGDRQAVLCRKLGGGDRKDNAPGRRRNSLIPGLLGPAVDDYLALIELGRLYEKTQRYDKAIQVESGLEIAEATGQAFTTVSF